jgi:hypothetical protein
VPIVACIPTCCDKTVRDAAATSSFTIPTHKHHFSFRGLPGPVYAANFRQLQRQPEGLQYRHLPDVTRDDKKRARYSTKIKSITSIL